MLVPAINMPILRIARRFGMAVRYSGGDAEARLDVPQSFIQPTGARP
jgi:hypothetical protein